jgi:nitroreductase
MEPRYTELDALVIRNRSCRRFKQATRIGPQTLVDMVNVARQSASAANRQPLRYQILYSEAACARIFPFLKWAALLKGWNGPADGERPAGYVLVYSRKAAGGLPQCDAGIAMQTLLLAAVARELAGCILGAIDRPHIMEAFPVPPDHELLYVVAFGHPGEQHVLEDATHNHVDYYRDEADVQHVPKLPMNEILLAAQ